MSYSVDERISLIWPEAKRGEVLAIGPLGRRQDTLLYWRTRNRVSTGMRGAGACFEGSLDDFSAAVEASYAAAIEGYAGNTREVYNRYRDEYRQVILMLRLLPSLIALDEPIAYG